MKIATAVDRAKPCRSAQAPEDFLRSKSEAIYIIYIRWRNRFRTLGARGAGDMRTETTESRLLDLTDTLAGDMMLECQLVERHNRRTIQTEGTNDDILGTLRLLILLGILLTISIKNTEPTIYIRAKRLIDQFRIRRWRIGH